MRNVTVSIPDEIAQWARIWAAEHDTSVSFMLSEILRERMEAERRYSSSMDYFLAASPTILSDGTGYPSRESLYER